MPMDLYQSCHTVNVSLKLLFYKTALKAKIACHLRAKRQKKQNVTRQAKTLIFAIQKLLVTVRCDEK